MRFTKSKLFIALTIVIIIISGVTIFAVSDNSSKIKTDAYVFPITPATNPDMWKSFQSLDEKVAACQIPDDVLKNMSTAGLVETCINYPMFGNALLFNSMQDGIEKSIKQFNGLQELLRRPDAGSELLKLYNDIDLSNIESFSKFPITKLQLLEMLIAQEPIISNMKLSERNKLLDVSLEKSKIKNEKYSQKFSQTTSAVLIGRLLKKDHPKFNKFLEDNKELDEFINKASNTKITTKEWDSIISNIENLK